MGLLPGPYLLLAVLIALAVSFGSGWHYGGKVVKAEWAGEKVAAAVAQADADQKVFDADKRADAEAAKRKAVEQTKQKVIFQEVVVHAQTLPDLPECALDPARVSTINRAFGETADTGNEAAAVPGAADAPERKSFGGGILGRPSWLHLPGMQ